MEYDQDEKQSKRDVRNGAFFTMWLIFLFVATGLLFSRL
jgi:hypothetical protein